MPSRDNPLPRILMPLDMLLQRAGYSLAALREQPEVLTEVRSLHERTQEDPNHALEAALRLRRETADSHVENAAVREVAEEAQLSVRKLEEILTKLLEGDCILGRLESMSRSHSGEPSAICRLGNQLHNLPIHPEVGIEQVAALMPWDYVAIRGGDEMMVIGVLQEPAFFHMAQGEVAEFRGWHDQERGLVRVARQGADESVVRLAAPLLDIADELAVPARLVLQRDDERWAIARVPVNNAECRFEIPIEPIQTKLTDVAGLDEIIEPLVRDILLRLVHPDLRERFDLSPLGGVLLSSYRPGMGKSMLIRALAKWLWDLGKRLDFDVALYSVKPNELKSKWHGEDGRLVREDLFGAIRARQRQARVRPLYQLLVLDEVDSLGSRTGGDDGGGATSSAANDVVNSMLAEIDGLEQYVDAPGVPPAQLVVIGLTNRPDMVDPALKRPGRMGDFVKDMPDPTVETGAEIMAVYASSKKLAWFLNGRLEVGPPQERLLTEVLRPALARVFDAPVLRYSTDARQSHDVTVGEVLAGVHLMQSMHAAKKTAALRSHEGTGVPGVTLEDVVDALLDQAIQAAEGMESHVTMLRRQLKIKVPIARVDLVPREELSDHLFVAPDSGAMNGAANRGVNGGMNGAGNGLNRLPGSGAEAQSEAEQASTDESSKGTKRW